MHSIPTAASVPPPPTPALLIRAEVEGMGVSTLDPAANTPIIRQRTHSKPMVSVHFDLTTPVVYYTFAPAEYDRHAIDYVAKQLTPNMAAMIKLELNEVKRGMEVHQDSRYMTQFYNVGILPSSSSSASSAPPVEKVKTPPAATSTAT